MVKSRGLRRWAGGKDNREAGKVLFLGTGALRPMARMAARDPKENSVAHLFTQYTFTVCPMERQSLSSPPRHPLFRTKL